jgi:tetratricopeptide (TPR) repeat protein
MNFFFCIFFKFEVTYFQRIFNELEHAHVLKNVFLALAKLGHECFKQNLLTTGEYLLEFALDRVDTSSLRLKMATLSTLSACYWRLNKFIESINCMHLELNLASYLNSLADESESNVDGGGGGDDVYNGNRYRIYGNLASAYQRLSNMSECLENLQRQLDLATNDMSDPQLVINSLNSIGLVHNRLKDYAKAIGYFADALDMINQRDGLGGSSDKAVYAKLKVKQLGLLGECSLKLGKYQKAKVYFETQLSCLSNDLGDENQNLSEAIALLNLGYVDFRLKAFESSIDFYEKCLSILLNLESSKSSQELVELFGSVYIGLVNDHLAIKDQPVSSMYAHGLLEYTLNELVKYEATRQKKRTSQLYTYLKFLEMTACFKLAICYAKTDQLEEALKLHEREAVLAKQLNNVLFLARAHSNMAQIHYLKKDYESSILLYKEILSMIEAKLLVSSEASSASTTTVEKFKRLNPDKFAADVDAAAADDDPPGEIDRIPAVMNKSDERLVEIIFFTLSNIGLCMERMEKFDEARSMFAEQVEISKLLGKSLKFRANSLLNIVNLYLNGKVAQQRPDDELVEYLTELFSVSILK